MERAKASSMLDQVTKHAKRVPGPANYNTAVSSLTNKGTVIPTALGKGLMDMAIEHASAVPGECALCLLGVRVDIDIDGDCVAGVGDYNAPTEQLRGAASFSNAVGDSMMAQTVKRAEAVPVRIMTATVTVLHSFLGVCSVLNVML